MTSATPELSANPLLDRGPAANEGKKSDAVDEELIDEDELSDSESSEDDTSDGPIVMGGSAPSPSFALLVGQFEDPKDGAMTPVSVPITQLPATLGRLVLSVPIFLPYPP